MIHEKSLVYSLAWKKGTKPRETDPSQIEYCRVTVLQIVGNLRLDCFLVARGDDTDV